jgi:ornithine cyclodeaminase
MGELLFDDPPGNCHIKYGYLKQPDTFAVKIATGFWQNLHLVCRRAMV